MINLRRKKYNLILGILVGILLAQIVLIEGSAIVANKQNSEFINSAWMSRENIIINAISFSIFLLSIIIFNSKAFRKVNFDKISVYLFLSLLITLFVTFEGMFILFRIVENIVPNALDYIANNNFIYRGSCFRIHI